MAEFPEPSAWGRQLAFQLLTRHPGCLKDDEPLNDLIDDIAARLDDARVCGARNGETPPARTDGEDVNE